MKQATVGDSGGGVFLSDGTLIGLIDAEGTFSGQPANTSVFGDGTFIADLSKYCPEILSIVAVPEMPTSILLLVGLALGVVVPFSGHTVPKLGRSQLAARSNREYR
jgi:hypothetical protein